MSLPCVVSGPPQCNADGTPIDMGQAEFAACCCAGCPYNITCPATTECEYCCNGDADQTPLYIGCVTSGVTLATIGTCYYCGTTSDPHWFKLSAISLTSAYTLTQNAGSVGRCAWAAMSIGSATWTKHYADDCVAVDSTISDTLNAILTRNDDMTWSFGVTGPYSRMFQSITPVAGDDGCENVPVISNGWGSVACTGLDSIKIIGYGGTATFTVCP